MIETGQVKYAWVSQSHASEAQERIEQFDAWLEAHDRDVQAKALEDAADESGESACAERAANWLRTRAAEIRGAL